MRVLGIETSCDETAAAVVADGHQVQANVVASQIARHADYGGVIPELAAREHLKAIAPVVDGACAEAGCGVHELDALAVTCRPGLLPALLVGLSYAKGLAAAADLPLVGVDHFLAHAMGTFLEHPEALAERARYPVLCLVVSGGHTALLLMRADGSGEIVGSTIDDAAGEAFDKAARILHLPYPGGPVIDRLAKDGDPAAHAFPRGLCGEGGGRALKPENKYNFSFSGVKTALLYHVKSPADGGVDLDAPVELDDGQLADLVAAYQEAVVDALVTKTLWAAADFGAATIAVCGGVACNSRLRALMRARATCPVYIAPPKYCTDNAAMIAGLGYYEYRAGNVAALDLDAATRLNPVSTIPFAGGRQS